MRTSLTIIAVLALLWSAKVAYVFVAPLTLAGFVLALAWPMQSNLQRCMHKGLAAVVTLSAATGVLMMAGSVIYWAVGAIWRDIAADPERYQALYRTGAEWLEDNGIAVAALWTDNFSINWLLRVGQQAFSRTSQFTSFMMVVIAYLLTGLIEVERVKRRIVAASSHASPGLVGACSATARKLRTYMWVRTVISLLTGFCFGLVIYAVGLPHASQWAVIALILNYIPFIGPLVATILPTLFALAQLGDPWTALVLFSALTVIQFVSGNYLEPLLSGDKLTLSPFVILTSIFMWTYLWGVYGTFIGVPIAIVVASLASASADWRWLAVMMGSADMRLPGTEKANSSSEQ